MNLRIPGPTPIPPSVRQAGAKQMINHRGPEFRDLVNGCVVGLKAGFQTKGDMVVLTSSGTGGLEAAISNVLSPGERTLVVTIGEFGDRVAKMCEVFGASVARLSITPGQPADPQSLRDALKKEPLVNTVFITHNETSTGVTQDLAALADVVKKEFGKTLVVDGVSSIGSLPFKMDEWGVDIAVSGSQKGWMTSPGLAFVAVSAQGWQAVKQAKMPRFYFDLNQAKDLQDKGQTPWTPAVSVLYQLQEGLRILGEEGWDNVHKRHQRIGDYTRQGAQQLGLSLFAKEGSWSNTITAINVPQGIAWADLNTMLLKEYATVLAGGQGALASKVFRIGHLGWVNEKDVQAALDSLESAIAKLRAKAPAAAHGKA